MLAFTRFEVVRTLRNGRFLVFLIAMPAVFFLLFGSRDGNGIHERGLSWPTFYLVSMVAYAAIGAAMWAGGPALALERASGWIRQLRTTPLSDRGWLSAKIAQALVLVVPGALLVALCGALVRHVHLSAAAWTEIAATTLLGALPFAFLGLVIGQALDGQAAQVGQFIGLFGLSILGGLWAPPSSLPSAVADIGRVLPSSHMASLGWDAAAGRALEAGDVLWLAGWALALGALALVLWRRRRGATVG